MKGKLQKTGKEVSLTEFEVLARHMLEELREFTNSLARLVGITLGIRNWSPPMTNKRRCPGATWLDRGYITVVVKEN